MSVSVLSTIYPVVKRIKPSRRPAPFLPSDCRELGPSPFGPRVARLQGVGQTVTRVIAVRAASICSRLAPVVPMEVLRNTGTPRSAHVPAGSRTDHFSGAVVDLRP